MPLHGTLYRVALLLFGPGSPLFCWLWWRSRHVPTGLAVFGLLASARVGVCMSITIVIVFPDVGQVLTVPWYGGPIFLFEVAIGLWLVARPGRAPAPPVRSDGSLVDQRK